MKEITATDGTRIRFDDRNPMSGGQKDVFPVSEPAGHVIAFVQTAYRDLYGSIPNRSRIHKIVTTLRPLLDTADNGYWRLVFCCPDKLVDDRRTEDDAKPFAFTMPKYRDEFIISPNEQKRLGIDGQGERTIELYGDVKNLFHKLPDNERGAFPNYLKIALKLAQAVRRLHSLGFIHTDLSLKNVLVNPLKGTACIIDIDGMSVEGMYDPMVDGTLDGTCAPEIRPSSQFPDETEKVRPSELTDRHSLAVLIYLLLLHRHPFLGGRYFEDDNVDDTTAKLWLDPIYIESEDARRLGNRNMKREVLDGIWPQDNSSNDDLLRACFPWYDLEGFSASKVCGPFLNQLFEKAFVNGVKNPRVRPRARDWEEALIRTSNLLARCDNPACSHKLFVCTDESAPVCPFCGTKVGEPFPILGCSEYPRRPWSAPPQTIVCYHEKAMWAWDVFHDVFPDETSYANPAFRLRAGSIRQEGSRWLWRNERTNMSVVDDSGNESKVVPGTETELKPGLRMRFRSSLRNDCAREMVVRFSHGRTA